MENGELVGSRVDKSGVSRTFTRVGSQIKELIFSTKTLESVEKRHRCREKLSSDKYSFFISSGDQGTQVSLMFEDKIKVFKLAGEPDMVGLVNHMCSLTDTQCEQWFSAREKKSKTKA
jgi:hypothetical protein